MSQDPLRISKKVIPLAAIISIASGKGGVGKSTTVSNLGLVLARRGLSVVLIDLDVGGADLHIMFGELSPKVTLSDFLSRKVETLADTAMPLALCPKLRLIAGTGDTLRNTNPASQTKRRLERHIRELAADVILLDIGAGTNLHALDFFLWADVPVLVSTPRSHVGDGSLPLHQAGRDPPGHQRDWRTRIGQ